MNILAIIPAKGHSERLERKNVYPLLCEPLIQYTIEEAKKSKLITRLIVATDDDGIGSIARNSGVETITLPAALTTPARPMPPVIQWVMLHLEKYGEYRPNIVVLLQPTSPLRTVEDIDTCIEVVRSNQADSLTTVCDGKENGAVYVMSRYLAYQGIMYGPSLRRYEMPKDRSVDINTMDDIAEAERIIKEAQGGTIYKHHESFEGKQRKTKGRTRRKRA